MAVSHSRAGWDIPDKEWAAAAAAVSGAIRGRPGWRLHPDEVDELTQEVIEKAFVKRRQYDPELGSLDAWCVGFIKFAVLDLVRKRPSAISLDQVGPMQCGPSEGPSIAEGTNREVLAEIAQISAEVYEETNHINQKALVCSLSGECRKITAARFGISEGTLNGRVHRLEEKFESRFAKAFRKGPVPRWNGFGDLVLCVGQAFHLETSFRGETWLSRRLPAVAGDRIASHMAEAIGPVVRDAERIRLLVNEDETIPLIICHVVDHYLEEILAEAIARNLDVLAMNRAVHLVQIALPSFADVPSITRLDRLLGLAISHTTI